MFTGLGTRGDRLHDAGAQVLVDEAEGDFGRAALTDAIWREWWFCSTHCRDEFTTEPARFTGRQTEQADATGQV